MKSQRTTSHGHPELVEGWSCFDLCQAGHGKLSMTDGLAFTSPQN
jgi:hypothetical protein